MVEKVTKKKKQKSKPIKQYFNDNIVAGIYPCKTCVEQCAGHGGGGVPVKGGCLCDDGTFQECM